MCNLWICAQNMTALIYLLKKNMICLAMDSIALTLDKTPIRYLTKFFLLPHLQCIVCGTGRLDLIMKWFDFIQNSLTYKNMVDLNPSVSKHLNKISRELEFQNNGSSTIYHFGIDKANDEMVAFAYRSTNAFESESLLIPSLGFKPNYSFIEDPIAIIEQKGIKKALWK